MNLYKKESFEVIFCRHTLEHSYAPRTVLREFGRILRNGGLFFIIVPVEDNIGPKHAYKFNDIESLKCLADNEGINIIKCFYKEHENIPPEIWLIATNKKDNNTEISNERAFFNMGIYFFKMNNFEFGIKWIKEAKNLNPNLFLNQENIKIIQELSEKAQDVILKDV
ncbi:MAG: methyltransferase domain-containing protein [bacterium]|nr:methyltransferase domain-containing protein [bacterium]